MAQPARSDAELPRAGRTFLDVKVYSAEDDRQLLQLFDGLRVADVSDGMDQAGLADVGLVNADVGPLWRDTKEFKHRIIGVAVTARYVPTNQPAARTARNRRIQSLDGPVVRRALARAVCAALA